MQQSTQEQLFNAALRGYERAYAPYSNFHVGAAILADDGKIYAGANVENAAYPQGNCAEASAIAAMVYGGSRRIKQIVILGKADHPVMPCGGCRQRLAEFSDKTTSIIIASPDGVQAQFDLDDLLPHRFGAKSLE